MSDLSQRRADARLHMAGLLVQAAKGRADFVSSRIGRLPGAVLHARSPSGKLVVTLESERAADIHAHLTRIQRMAGVLSAVLVSEHSEPLDTIDEELSHGNEAHAS